MKPLIATRATSDLGVEGAQWRWMRFGSRAIVQLPRSPKPSADAPKLMVAGYQAVDVGPLSTAQGVTWTDQPVVILRRTDRRHPRRESQRRRVSNSGTNLNVEERRPDTDQRHHNREPGNTDMIGFTDWGRTGTLLFSSHPQACACGRRGRVRHSLWQEGPGSSAPRWTTWVVQLCDARFGDFLTTMRRAPKQVQIRLKPSDIGVRHGHTSEVEGRIRVGHRRGGVELGSCRIGAR